MRNFSKIQMGFYATAIILILFLAVLLIPGAVHAQDGPVSIQGPMIKIVADPASPTPVYIPRRTFSSYAPQAATITVTYVENTDGCDESVDSWDDIPDGDTRTLKQAFEAAVSTWEGLLDSNVEIRVEATLENIGGDTLGYMGPRGIASWSTAPVDNVWFASAIADKINDSDLDANNYDITGKMTCRTDWNTDDLDSDGDGYSGEYDFESVAVHELGHGMGFMGGASYNNGVGGVRDDNQNWPWVYTCFTGSTNPHGRYLLNTDEFPEDSTKMGDVLTNKGGTSNGGLAGVYFYGDQAVDANNGDPIKLYIPNTWKDGSSYSHLDSATYNGTAEDLMTPSIGAGDITRDVGPITQAMFNDFGWEGEFNAEACDTPTPNAATMKMMTATTFNMQSAATPKNTWLLLGLGALMMLGAGAFLVFRQSNS